MSIQQSELIWRQPEIHHNDTGANGGRMTSTEIAPGVKNNIWGDVSQYDRDNGKTEYAKVFIHVANDDDIELINPRVFVETPTPGEDSVTIFLGTHTNTQSTLGSDQQYGCGALDSDAIADAVTIDVLTEGQALDYFKNGMLVRISDKATVDGVGNEQYVTLTADATYVGDPNVATLVFDIADKLADGYSALDTRVSSVLEPATVEALYSDFTVTGTNTGSGDYDDSSTDAVVMDSIGSVAEDWTITFSNATTYTLTNSAAETIVEDNNINTTLQPINPGFPGKPYFTLDPANFSGSFNASDTITFTTTPCSIPVWYMRDIHIGASSLAGDSVFVGIDGESA